MNERSARVGEERPKALLVAYIEGDGQIYVFLIILALYFFRLRPSCPAKLLEPIAL